MDISNKKKSDCSSVRQVLVELIRKIKRLRYILSTLLGKIVMNMEIFEFLRAYLGNSWVSPWSPPPCPCCGLALDFFAALSASNFAFLFLAASSKLPTPDIADNWSNNQPDITEKDSTTTNKKTLKFIRYQISDFRQTRTS